jgi:ATP-dependent DNA helicase RecG
LVLLRVAIDGAVIEAARDAAKSVIDTDPELAKHPALRAAIDRRLSVREREFLGKS